MEKTRIKIWESSHIVELCDPDNLPTHIQKT
jgi:hypothetical protein